MRRTLLIAGAIAVVTAITGVLHYTDASADRDLHRLRRRARRARLARRRRDRVGRSALRAGRDRRTPVDARQPARALHRPLRALGRRDRRRADLDPRLAVRERAARARARDRRGARASATDGVMRFRARLPNDTATLLMLLASFGDRRCSALSDRLGDRASEHAGRDLGRRRGLPARRLRRLALVVPALATPAASRRSRSAAGACRSRRRSCSSRVAGVGAAFVSDWFVAALDPAVRGARDLEGVHRHRDRRHRRERGRERRRDHARGEGPGRPRRLGDQELGRADRVLPVPRARPALALLRRPADVRRSTRCYIGALARDGDRGLGRSPATARRTSTRGWRSSRSTSSSRRSSSTSSRRASAGARPRRAVSSRHSPGARPREVEARVAAAVEAAHRVADGLAASASPGACAPRGSSARRGPSRGGGRCAGAVRPSSSSMPSLEPA